MFKFWRFWIITTILNAKVAKSAIQKRQKSAKNLLHTTLSKAINITRVAWEYNDSNVTLPTIALPKRGIKRSQWIYGQRSFKKGNLF